MKTNEIKIDRVEVRLKNSDRNSARALGASIREEVLQQIAQQVNIASGRRSIRIANIDAGTVRLENAGASGSGSTIARQIAKEVSMKIAPVSSDAKR
jgi:predicted metalloprotease